MSVTVQVVGIGQFWTGQVATGQTFFGPKIFLNQKFCLSQNLFGPKICLDPKYFLDPRLFFGHIFWTQNVVG